MVGLTLEEAKSLTAKEGLRLRVSKVDGQHKILTRDYRLDRINVELVKDKVVAAVIG